MSTYLEDVASIHKTDDGKHVLSVRQKPKKEKPGKPGEPAMVMPSPDPMTYVAEDADALHCLIDEHVLGKKKTAQDKFDKGWRDAKDQG